jgi:hypothetical protein
MKKSTCLFALQKYNLFLNPANAYMKKLKKNTVKIIFSKKIKIKN